MERIATFTKPFQIRAEIVELTNNSNVVVAEVKNRYINPNTHFLVCLSCVAEREGFEPSKPLRA